MGVDLNLGSEIAELFSSGDIHLFEFDNLSFLYVRDSNSFFKITDFAKNTLKRLQNGEQVDEGPLREFQYGWSSINRSLALRRLRILRIYLNQTDNFNDFVHLRPGLEVGLNSADQCEVIVQLTDQWIQSQEYLSKLMAELEGIFKVHNVKVFIVVKLPATIIDERTIKYLHDKKMIIIPVVNQENYNETLVKMLSKLGIKDIEVITTQPSWRGFNLGIKNLFRLAESSDESRVYSVETNPYLPLYNLSSRQILESVDNTYRFFEILSSNKRLDTKILMLNSEGTNPELCDKCWARNACWSSKNYETFARHPYEMNLVSKFCEATYLAFEKIMGILYGQQQKIFEEENIRRQFLVNETDVIELINP